MEGVLVSDAEGRQIRFEGDERAQFVIQYDRLVATHYEKAGYPRRFLRRSSFYLTLHYSDADGRPSFETIRLLSERDALSALATLERDTGRTFDRSPATQSFEGIPIRARIGAKVAVTDQAGRITKGTIAALSAVSLVLAESTGHPRDFDEASVRKIRLLYSPKRDVLLGLGTGAAIGAFLGANLASQGGCPSDGCHRLSTAAKWAGIVGGLGAVIVPTVGAVRYPFNKAFDVYRGDTRSGSTPSAVTVEPQVTPVRTSVLVSVRF